MKLRGCGSQSTYRRRCCVLVVLSLASLAESSEFSLADLLSDELPRQIAAFSRLSQYRFEIAANSAAVRRNFSEPAPTNGAVLRQRRVRAAAVFELWADLRSAAESFRVFGQLSAAAAIRRNESADWRRGAQAPLYYDNLLAELDRAYSGHSLLNESYRAFRRAAENDTAIRGDYVVVLSGQSSLLRDMRNLATTANKTSAAAVRFRCAFLIFQNCLDPFYYNSTAECSIISKYLDIAKDDGKYEKIQEFYERVLGESTFWLDQRLSDSDIPASLFSYMKSELEYFEPKREENHFWWWPFW